MEAYDDYQNFQSPQSSYYDSSNPACVCKSNYNQGTNIDESSGKSNSKVPNGSPEVMVSEALEWEGKFTYKLGGSKYPPNTFVNRNGASADVGYAINFDSITDDSPLDCGTFVAFILYKVDLNILKQVAELVLKDDTGKEYIWSDGATMIKRITGKGGKIRKDNPKNGDIVFWIPNDKNKYGHVEIITLVEENGQTINSIGATGAKGEATPKSKGGSKDLYETGEVVSPDVPPTFLGFWSPY